MARAKTTEERIGALVGRLGRLRDDVNRLPSLPPHAERKIGEALVDLDAARRSLDRALGELMEPPFY